MHTTVYVDGDQGTTGLRIVQRLAGQPGIRLHTLPSAQRKDPLRRAALHQHAARGGGRDALPATQQQRRAEAAFQLGHMQRHRRRRQVQRARRRRETAQLRHGQQRA